MVDMAEDAAMRAASGFGGDKNYDEAATSSMMEH
jgi:hypothetical protein